MPKVDEVSMSDKNEMVSVVKPSPDDLCTGKFYINSAGKCTECHNADAFKEAATCLVCRNRFHALCHNSSGVKPDTICTQSFLKLYTPLTGKTGNNADRFGLFCFLCDECVIVVGELNARTKPVHVDMSTQIGTEHTSVSDSQNESGLDIATTDVTQNPKDTVTLDQMKILLSGMKKDILDNVNKVIDSKISSSANQATSTPDLLSENHLTYSAAFKEKGHPSNILSQKNIVLPPEASNIRSTNQLPAIKTSSAEVLILDSPVSHIEDLASVKSIITEALYDTPLVFVNVYLSQKKVTIGFPSNAARRKGKQILMESSAIKKFGFMFTDRMKALPKVTVSNIPAEIFSNISSSELTRENYRIEAKKILLEHILLKNDGIKSFIDQDHSFEIIYINVGERYATGGIKVSPQLHDYMIHIYNY